MISECRPYAEKNAVVVYGPSICDELRPQVFAIHRYSTEYRYRLRLFPSRRVWRSIETPTSTDGDITGRNVQPLAQTTAVCQRVRDILGPVHMLMTSENDTEWGLILTSCKQLNS